jgi:hypothetical protein
MTGCPWLLLRRPGDSLSGVVPGSVFTDEQHREPPALPHQRGEAVHRAAVLRVIRQGQPVRRTGAGRLLEQLTRGAEKAGHLPGRVLRAAFCLRQHDVRSGYGLDAGTALMTPGGSDAEPGRLRELPGALLDLIFRQRNGRGPARS